MTGSGIRGRAATLVAVSAAMAMFACVAAAGPWTGNDEPQSAWETAFLPREAAQEPQARRGPAPYARASMHGRPERHRHAWHRRERRHVAARPSRYMALPKPEIPIRPHRDAPQAKPALPRMPPAGDPVLALLGDTTLRRGDIVMLRDGPNVFVGNGIGPHVESDFENAAGSRAVGRRTRKLLASLVKPEANPAAPALSAVASGVAKPAPAPVAVAPERPLPILSVRMIRR